MKDQPLNIQTFKSISKVMQYLHQPAPLHPLIALVNYDESVINAFKKGAKICMDFYKISFKTSFNGQVKYGQGYYDFEAGGMAFLRPKQIIFSPDDDNSYEGYSLFFHPDLISNHSLSHTINQYGFFSYDVAEALFLSDKEKQIISNLFKAIQSELDNNIDVYSQDVLIAQIALLLHYSNRFYNRQFITRKASNRDLIARLDKWLEDYYNNETPLEEGFPAIPTIAAAFNLSQRYLSDLLRSSTGQNTQQYLQGWLIEKAKQKLSTTSLSVSEIAYALGFQHPQSFSKLFKTRTLQSPSAFRDTFN